MGWLATPVESKGWLRPPQTGLGWRKATPWGWPNHPQGLNKKKKKKKKKKEIGP
jgi:hypothetical protein